MGGVISAFFFIGKMRAGEGSISYKCIIYNVGAAALSCPKTPKHKHFCIKNNTSAII